MEQLNKIFIFSRIKELKITDDDFRKFGLAFDKVFAAIMNDDYSLIMMIKLSIILDCNMVDLFVSPDENTI